MSVINSVEAIKIAAAYAEAQGFEMTGRSNISEAVYLERPGFDGSLRLAAHSCRHGYDVIAGLEMFDDDDRFPPALGYNITGYSRADIEALAAEAIAAYDAKAEKIED